MLRMIFVENLINRKMGLGNNDLIFSNFYEHEKWLYLKLKYMIVRNIKS